MADRQGQSEHLLYGIIVMNRKQKEVTTQPMGQAQVRSTLAVC